MGESELNTNARDNVRYAIGLFRAALGALIFALPLTMTAEMWELGATIDPMRLAILLGLTLPMLVALSYYAGFEPTFTLIDNVLDAFAAIAVSTIACLAVLWLFGEISLGAPVEEIVGKLTVLAFGASVGALLADKQFGDDPQSEDAKSFNRGFGGRLFVMGVGAIYLSLNVAPTEEVQNIAASIGPVTAATLACVSFAVLACVLVAADPETRAANWVCQARRAFAGYGVCVLLSAFILWCFGRFDGVALTESVEMIIVLGFPASLGAGAARLIFGDQNDTAKG